MDYPGKNIRAVPRKIFTASRSFLDISFKSEKEALEPGKNIYQRISTIAVFIMIYAALFYIFRPSLLLSPTMTAGGDTATHHFGIRFLMEELLPQGRLTGFSLDWYAGMPMISFYFPLPYLMVALLSHVIEYNLSFNIVTVLGTFLLPPAVYIFIRSLKFKFPYPLLGSVFSLIFLFMESYSIYGANMLSTMAGEFGYSLSFAMVFLFLAVFKYSVWKPGLNGFFILAVLALAATALSHVLTTLCLVVMMPGYSFYGLKKSLLWRSGTILVTGFLLTAFWSIPFAFNLGFTPNMGWKHITTPRPLAVNELLFSLVLCLGAVAVYSFYLRARDKRPALLFWSLAMFTLLFFVPTGGRVWNARILPFYYITVHLLAAYLLYILYFGFLGLLKKRAPSKARWLQLLYAPIILAIALSVILGSAPVAASWAKWNYSGYENQEGWPLYREMMDHIKGLEHGRFMVEQDKEKVQKFGTSRAFELIPLHSGHPVMEGLLVEGAFSSPFHFINQAELSDKPSNAIPSLQKPPTDISMGLRHLQLFNVRYMIASSEDIISGLRKDPRTTLLTTFEDFYIFEVQGSRQYVEVPDYLPVRVKTPDWYSVAKDWYMDEEALDVPIIWDRGEGGLGAFTLIDESQAPDPPRHAMQGNGNIVLKVLENERISFETDQIGKPHIIKVSYFPNWKAEGALGPFVVSPSFMLVVPTQNDVLLSYGKTRIDSVSDFLSAAGVLSLLAITYLSVLFARRKAKKQR
jgi:hypothetical protein